MHIRVISTEWPRLGVNGIIVGTRCRARVPNSTYTSLRSSDCGGGRPRGASRFTRKTPLCPRTKLGLQAAGISSHKESNQLCLKVHWETSSHCPNSISRWEGEFGFAQHRMRTWTHILSPPLLFSIARVKLQAIRKHTEYKQSSVFKYLIQH